MKLLSTLSPGLQTVRTPFPGILVVCPGCGKTFTPRRPNHRYCSTTCRIVWFQQKEARARRERDAQVRLSLKAGLAAQDPDTVRQQITEALDLLTDEESPHHKQGGHHADEH